MAEETSMLLMSGDTPKAPDDASLPESSETTTVFLDWDTGVGKCVITGVGPHVLSPPPQGRRILLLLANSAFFFAACFVVLSLYAATANYRHGKSVIMSGCALARVAVDTSETASLVYSIDEENVAPIVRTLESTVAFVYSAWRTYVLLKFPEHTQHRISYEQMVHSTMLGLMLPSVVLAAGIRCFWHTLYFSFVYIVLGVAIQYARVRSHTIKVVLICANISLAAAIFPRAAGEATSPSAFAWICVTLSVSLIDMLLDRSVTESVSAKLRALKETIVIDANTVVFLALYLWHIFILSELLRTDNHKH